MKDHVEEDRNMKICDELAVAALFSKCEVAEYKTVNTSHGEDDFREAIFVEFTSGDRIVIKVSCNEFTTVKSIEMWRQCAESYIEEGYYSPRILPSLNGDFPCLVYKEHDCVAYAEEYSKYKSVEDSPNAKPWRNDVYKMTAKIAQHRYDYTDMPSGYCLFELFPGDEFDEVTMNAKDFLEYALTLPKCFHEQVKRMYNRWLDNYNELRRIYFLLPFSVFQADFNFSNVLVDENGDFAGIYDFNLAGKDEILNYLFREIYTGSFEEELTEIFNALKIVSSEYVFSEAEIAAAPMIYRCVKPLWYTRVETLKSAGDKKQEIQRCLDEMEYAQTRMIDFERVMSF